MLVALFVRSWDRARKLEDGLAGRGYEDVLTTLEPERVRSRAFLLGSVGLIGAVVAGSWAAGVIA